ncbi:ABC transporter substrate-binding protein [Desulfovibrio aerotolerans]|uniref:ABC transporter substrate-binding protein n=1 Tax=Solidesulfovibrio aerotolerans TaxID=295255 RepID=A0A7C9IWZ4_9BACT|nr:ABC transporter substrate-binding protein [Solidesulfovibrio aerotolerans]MYL85263.1 ABC transporter substrate-binding protein [Solidesulfovibrio aerotolerans]
MRRLIVALLFVVVFAIPALAEELPVLKVSYVFTTHHTPLMVAAMRGEAFQDQGVYLKTVAPKERYELISHGKPVAVLDFVVAKSGAETATLFAQNHVDLAMASVTAIMAGVDKGTGIKVVAPMQTEGMALVAPKGSPLANWDDLVAKAKAGNEPMKIGYHSPTSAPKIVLEGALKQAGIAVTENPNDTEAKILLVDLKETTNMIPALVAGQVEAVVGPSPFPEMAVAKGVGQVVVDLKDLPPAGFWRDYPCCVTVAGTKCIAEHPQVVQAFVDLVIAANTWSNDHKSEAGALTAEWIGMPPEAGKASSLSFLSGFSESWMRNTGNYLAVLNAMDKFTGQLKGKTIDDVKPLLFDMRFIEKTKP